MKKTVIKHDAADPKAGMSFDELQRFALEAMAVDAVSSNKIIRVRTTWRGTIRSLQITLEHDDN